MGVCVCVWVGGENSVSSLRARADMSVHVMYEHAGVPTGKGHLSLCGDHQKVIIIALCDVTSWEHSVWYACVCRKVLGSIPQSLQSRL